MTKLTQATAVAIATACSQVRGDWDHPGILHALRVEADKGTSAEDVFVAIANLAANHEARTPGLLNRPGRHWQRPNASVVGRRGDHNQACPDHPGHDQPCPHSDHAGDMTPEQIAEAARAVRAAAEAARTHRAARPTPAPEPHDLEQVRAQADKETKA